MPPSLPRTVAAIEEGFAQGLHLGAQVYVSRIGEMVVDLALGENQRGAAMSTDTLMLWQSCTKPLIAILAARLWDQGRLGLDDTVATHIPEFGNRGKEAVTIRHILTHTAGFRFVMLRWFSQTWEENFERLCNAELEPGWTPGEKAGYHAASSWFILAEVLRRIDGRPVERMLREDLFLPLGMTDSWLAMTPEQFYAYDERIGITYDTSGPEPKPLALVNDEEGCTRARPGSSGRGPIRELGRFYEMLLNGGERDGTRILQPDTVTEFTKRQRVGIYDHTFQCIVDWGLGFLVDSKQYPTDTFPYHFGPYCSPETFGHGGYQSSVSFADPQHGLVVAIAFNGTPGEQKHKRRMRRVLGAVYEDLGLAA